MSTKIYNGFRINAGDALANLNVLTTLREPLQALVDVRAAQVLAERITDEVDRYCVVRYCHQRGVGELSSDWAERSARHVWWDIGKDVRQEQRECRASLERSPLVDCDISLFLRADPQDGKLYGYLHEEGAGAYEALLRIPGVEDYAYWNNTDRPDHLTEQDWDERKSTWYRLLEADLACLTLRFEPTGPTREEVLQHIPSLEQRARNRAVSYVENVLFKSWSRRRAAREDDDRADMSGVFRLLSKIQRRIRRKSPVYMRPVESLTAQFLEVLPGDMEGCLTKALGELPPCNEHLR